MWCFHNKNTVYNVATVLNSISEQHFIVSAVKKPGKINNVQDSADITPQ